MKVLVTGASGKLGKAVVEKLRAEKFHPVGADLIPGPATTLLMDIRNELQVFNACQDMDAVIHTAAVHGKHYELNYPRSEFIDTNISGTLNLLNAAVHHRIRRFLYVSTTSIYGSSMEHPDQAVWVDEELEIRPRDIYDISKQAAEQLCKDFFDKEGLQASVYRVGRFLPEHPNMQANHRLYRGLDERDGARALFLALQHDFANFEIFNIASTSAFTKADLELLKKDPQRVIHQMYPGAKEIYASGKWVFPESIDRVYVTGKAEKILGYLPAYTFGYLLENAGLS